MKKKVWHFLNHNFLIQTLVFKYNIPKISSKTLKILN